MRKHLAKILHRQMLEQLPSDFATGTTSNIAAILWGPAWVLAGHSMHVSLLFTATAVWMILHG